jgi:hypothetical protein
MTRLVNLEKYISSPVAAIRIAQRVQRRAMGDGRWAGRPGLDFRQGKQIFVYSTASRPPLAPTQPPTHRVLGAVSPGVQRPKREADHSPPSRAWVKNGGAIPPLPRKSPWRCA